ncbi:MAG TPA: hypothetical protein VF041_01930 [Gemmatimonadaceae bacterium]
MIVYRASERLTSPAVRLGELARQLDAASERCPASHDTVRELLIELGAVEAVVADALHPAVDDLDAASAACAACAEATARAATALRLSWDGAPGGEIAGALRRAARAACAASACALPGEARAGTPEGYAYYGVYPEAYLEAGRRVARERRPPRVVCVGVRGIGTSLAAAARAGLEREGCRTHAFNVRPRGHPFARRIELGAALRDAMRAVRDALWLVADEGPGLSGSSFAAVAGMIAELGVPDRDIVLLPSWVPDGARFVSDLARHRWRRHAKVCVSFEELFANGRRLTSDLGEGELVDISGGEWRRHWLAPAREWPATQPQHERRKYLLAPAGAADRLRERPGPRALAAAAREGARVVKFAGLGRWGRAAHDRATRLARAGFSPEPLALAHGFLAFELIPGAPLRARARPPRLVERVARYLAFVSREFHTGDAARRDGLADMLAINAREALGERAGALAERTARLGAALPEARAVALDARMLPHEWVRHGRVLVKTDGTDHHDDHFHPGPQDPAWDIAAAAVELALAPHEEDALARRYAMLTGDAEVGERLAFYRAAYLAHRVGYAALAGSSLSGTPEGARWRREVRRYTSLLRRAIARVSRAA